jgi:uroporphyrinogen-III decarboxylase
MLWRRDVITRTGQDWFYLPVCGSREDRLNTELQVRGDDVFRVDKLSGKQEKLVRPEVAGWSASGGSHSYQPARMLKTEKELDEAFPTPPPFDARAFRAEGRCDLADALKREFDLFPVCQVNAPLWLCYYVWGFEGMMSMVADRPNLVKYACERLAASALSGVRQAAALGAAGIWIEECLTDMISPAAFAEINVPFVRRIVEEIRACGMKSIYYFCGNPAGKWEHLLATGADALSLEESKKGFAIDIEDMVERVRGRCAVLGNLDAINLLPNASESELRAEIRWQIAAGRRNGSRFIMSLGSPVTPQTPVERVRLYCDLAHELG